MFRLNACLDQLFVASDVERIIISVSKTADRKGIAFEPSYRAIYNLCMTSKVRCKRSNVCCGYCELQRLLKKHEHIYKKNLYALRTLLDICLYPLNMKKYKDLNNQFESSSGCSNTINDWFNINIKAHYDITAYDILKIYRVPREICTMISSHVYDASLLYYHDLLEKIIEITQLQSLYYNNTIIHNRNTIVLQSS